MQTQRWLAWNAMHNIAALRLPQKDHGKTGIKALAVSPTQQHVPDKLYTVNAQFKKQLEYAMHEE